MSTNPFPRAESMSRRAAHVLLGAPMDGPLLQACVVTCSGSHNPRFTLCVYGDGHDLGGDGAEEKLERVLVQLRENPPPASTEMVTVPAAELERLREIERCARELVEAIDHPQRIRFYPRVVDLRAAIGAK